MRVSPLSITYPDWDTFNTEVQKTLGFSPSEGLGSTVIDFNSPSAFLACLDLSNQQTRQLRSGVTDNSTYDHFFASFICSLEDSLLYEIISSFSNLKYFCQRGKKEYIAIISASMTDWYIAVLRALSKGQSLEVRQVFFLIYDHFTNLGFREVWSKYNEVILDDNTIILA